MEPVWTPRKSKPRKKQRANSHVFFLVSVIYLILCTMQKLHAILIWALFGGLFCLSPTWSQEPTQLEITGRTMGPIKYKVLVAHHPSSVEPEQLQELIQGALDRVNGLMSTYLPESDVSRFNDADSTEYQPVNRETAMVVARAIEISRQTDGAFDITVGPAVNLWNFGPEKSEFQIPSDEQIANVKTMIGYEKLSVQMDPPAISKSEPSLRIDLSAIAKGYAVDQVAKALDEAGCKKFMVEVGGEVFTRGERSVGGKWRIAIEKPNYSSQQAYDKVAEISNLGMATSGDYRNYSEVDGVKYSHTIDPKTCRPVTHDLASACVIATDCMTADALATAVMVMGPKQGASVCDTLGVEYLTMTRIGGRDDVLDEKRSASFPLRNLSGAAPEKNVGAGQSIWPTFIGATVVFVLVILGMAVGSIFANKPVRGSCGGLANMAKGDGEAESCGVCSKPTTDCVEKAGSV